MKTAFLFPGQASQKVGMGLDLYNETEIGKNYFDIANEIMQIDLRDIAFNGPEDTLKQTRYTQPAIYIVSVILGELLKNNGHNAAAVAGHSLGEYSALTYVNAFDFNTGMKLVKLRAESMQVAGTLMKGTMAAIIGLDRVIIDEICKNYSKGIIVPANFNAPGQIVVSGETDAVKDVMALAKESGARMVVELNVSGAFHSPLMTSAKEALSEKLKSIVIEDIEIPIYSNVTAEPIKKAADIRQNLINQLDNAVQWQDTILNMINNNIARFVEVGPGKVLQGLNKRIDRNINSSGIQTNIDVNSYTNE
jgi:[acyl-carrier-protein] S-malonyltransferase